MEKVSVIVPAYNVEKYVHRAIESVLNQTYENVELVIVDDGSKDGTWSVIQQYAESEKVIAIQQKNKGVSVARNTALDAMTGDYCVFLDSDDWLEENAIETLINYQSINPEVLVAGSAYYVINRGGRLLKKLAKSPESTVIVDARTAMLEIGTAKYNLRSSCFKLFDKKQIGSLRFSTGIYYGEDGLFVFEYLQKCNGLLFSTEPLWDVLERPGSATTAPYNAKWLTAIEASEKMLAYAQDDEELRDALILNVIDRTQIVEKSAIKVSTRSNGILIAREKILEYKKAFFSKKRGIKLKIKFYMYAFLPLRLLRVMVLLVDKVKKN